MPGPAPFLAQLNFEHIDLCVIIYSYAYLTR